MKLTIKTLQQVTFQIEAELAETIGQIKAKIESAKGFPVASQKLIHSGKILVDDQTVESYNISEKDFVVVMVAKPKVTSPAVPTPVAAPTPAAASSAPVSTPAASSTAPVSTAPLAAFDSSTLATGAAYKSAVDNMIEMGFPREDVMKCMKAAFNNPDRAVEYLMSGIPEGLAHEAPAPTPAASQPQPPLAQAQPATPGQPLNLFEAAAAAQAQTRNTRPAGGAGGQNADLSALRDSEQFQQLRRLVATQPELLQPLLQQLGQTNPQLLQTISENQDQFMEMMGLGAEGGGEEGDDHYITISPEEDAAIQRLTALGFERNLAIEAYMACDKNEELAANYLFDSFQEGAGAGW